MENNNTLKDFIKEMTEPDFDKKTEITKNVLSKLLTKALATIQLKCTIKKLDVLMIIGDFSYTDIGRQPVVATGRIGSNSSTVVNLSQQWMLLLKSLDQLCTACLSTEEFDKETLELFLQQLIKGSNKNLEKIKQEVQK